MGNSSWQSYTPTPSQSASRALQMTNTMYVLSLLVEAFVRPIQYLIIINVLICHITMWLLQQQKPSKFDLTPLLPQATWRSSTANNTFCKPGLIPTTTTFAPSAGTRPWPVQDHRATGWHLLMSNTIPQSECKPQAHKSTIHIVVECISLSHFLKLKQVAMQSH